MGQDASRSMSRSASPTHKGGAAQFDAKGGWLRSWEPLKEPQRQPRMRVWSSPGQPPTTSPPIPIF